MDALAPRPTETRPDFERERDKVIAAAAARLDETRRPPPSVTSPAVPDTDLVERLAELEQRLASAESALAGAESALAEAVAARHRAEEALANTQLEHLRSFERVRELEARVAAPAAHEPAATTSAPAPSPDDPIPAAGSSGGGDLARPDDRTPSTQPPRHLPDAAATPLHRVAAGGHGGYEAPAADRDETGVPAAERATPDDVRPPERADHADADVRPPTLADDPDEVGSPADAASLRNRLIAAAQARRGRK